VSDTRADITQLVQDKREEILRLAAKHGAVNVRVFGSLARGEAGPDSDVDLLVDAAPVHSSWFPGGLLADLEDLLGCPVDVVTEKALHWYIRDHVLKEAVPLEHLGPRIRGNGASVNRDMLYLVHIRECIARVERFVSDGRDSFMDSDLIQDAVIRNLQLIGQSSLNLRAETRAAHPEINWSSVVGFRNIVVHQYLAIDLDKVWNIVEDHLPVFKQNIESMLRDAQDVP
jgi:uncharacterized protein with HEPN domain/predicted nucleotidyltransferase